MIKMEKELRNLEELNPRSQLLLVCSSCFKLKPSVIAELSIRKNPSTCSWCDKTNSLENGILLLETKSSNYDGGVKYDVIRKCNFHSNALKTKCKKNLGLKWKPCPDRDNCPNAHNEIELKIWNLETQFGLSRSVLVEKFHTSTVKEGNLQGMYHCVFCSKNLPNGKEFYEHCCSKFHKDEIQNQELICKHRDLPLIESLVLCKHELLESGSCEYGERCLKAHSDEELKEWKYFRQLKKDKLKYASDMGLMSFQDTILHEYRISSSYPTVLRDSISGVKVTLNHKLSQKVAIQKRIGKFAWIIKIHCTNHKEKLNHAAFISLGAGNNVFQICRYRNRKRSKPTAHLNFKALEVDNCSRLNLDGGDGSFEVTFEASKCNNYSSSLVLEFRNCPRPALRLDFCVEVLLVQNALDLLSFQHVEDKIVSWEAKKKIIRWDNDTDDDYSNSLKEICNRYKNPDVSLECMAERSGRRGGKYDPTTLTKDNYVEEMHNFLYREEKARTKLLDKPRCFFIVFTSCYKSSKSGMLFCSDGELFAIFELPNSLNRDTDEGLLVLDSCNKVLVCRKAHSASSVYEAWIKEKFIDHIVILLSKRCVKEWGLASGQVLESLIQFQFDREKFCRCHFALDQLKNNKQLGLVCPSPKANFRAGRALDLDFDSAALNNDQKKVLAFLKLKTEESGHALPLLLVQGSFGTGKTFTICQCIKSLLQHDKNAKILICTHSNSAADLYILNNFDDVDQWQSKVIRVLYHGRNPKSVPQLVLQYCLYEGNQFNYPTAQHIASHQVFIATFETALSLGSLGTSLEGCFTHIFLDEVAQVMEPAAIIPLTLANSKSTKVVIAGDHKQMTEKIYSKEDVITQSDSDFTLLARMYNIYVQQMRNHRIERPLNDHGFLVVLRKNYRCVRQILELIETLFYAKELLVYSSNLQPLPNLNPIQFHDVSGTCALNRLTGGYINETEAFYIAELVQFLLTSYRDHLQESDIAVVASYQDQVQVIRSILRKEKEFHAVKVETVRNVQGLEYKIVILSCVHKREAKEHKDGEKFGLLSDRDVLNTAFTRSKLAIIAVGHAVTLWTLGKCSIMWINFIKHCFDSEGLFPDDRTPENIQLEAAMRDFSALNPFAQDFEPEKKALPASAARTKVPVANPAFTITEDDTAHDETYEEEETLPFQDDILDDIVRNHVGINPDDIVIKVDKSGMEIVTKQANTDENDKDSGSKKVYSDFSLDRLQAMLANNPEEYKKCTLHVKTWYSADAVVHDAGPNLELIRINTKFNLGRAFNQDEVVVHIEKKNYKDDPESDGEKPIVYGKVVGILSRYRDPAEINFICVPDDYNPSFMSPIDQKTTKFFVKRRKRMGNNSWGIPICRLKKDENGNEVPKIERFVPYEPFSMTLDKSKHFIVRFLKWPSESTYPIGYVSEEIEPKNFERYYSLLYDVPSEFREKSAVNKSAEALAHQSVKGFRRNLKTSFVFTIDPEGSTDLDDAMSLDKCTAHDKCWKVGIHIADVASVVPADDVVDLEARKRATSFYSGNVNRNEDRKGILMIPKILSSKKCSLLADGEKRPAISIFLHSTKLPVLVSSKKQENKKGFALSVSNLPTPELTYVTSRKRMTYREAEICLRKVRQDGAQDITECNENNLGDQLYIIWKTMLRLRFQRIDWSSFYMQPNFNRFDKFCGDASAHMLIEEAMITYNSCCSHFLEEKKCDFLLKTQNPPSSVDTLKWKKENINSIALSLHQQGCLKDLHGQDVIRQLENEPQSPTNIPIFPHVWVGIQKALASNDLDTALILFSCDSLQPALSPGHSGYISIQNKAVLQSIFGVYKSTTPGSVTHFSLRLPLYSWFSSPIRRYTDIQNQRLILENISTSKKLKNPKVIEISKPKSLDLTNLGKTVMRRNDDAKQYEKNGRNFSYALSLSHGQNYEAASIKEVSDSGVSLEFVDLRNLPRTSCRLRYSDLRLAMQNKKEAAQSRKDKSWRIKYFEVEKIEQSPDENPFSNFTSTVVASTKWSTLLCSIKSLVFGDSSEEPIDEHSRNLLKTNFDDVIESQIVQQVCNRASTQRNGPCNNEKCRKKKVCRDFLDGRSKLGIYHYRVITTPLALGTPLLVQLYCGVKRGICVPSVQLLALSQDLDICIAHNSSPVETFAADVRPILTADSFQKSDKQVMRFENIKEYANYWLPLLRMDGVYNAVKDEERSSSTILQNVLVTFDDSGDNSQLNPHKRSFTWVVHAVIQSAMEEKQQYVEIVKVNFSACVSLVGDSKIPTAIKRKGNNVRVLVELIQLGAAHRGFANALDTLKASKDDKTRNDKKQAAIVLDNKEIILNLCLEGPHEVRPLPSSINKVVHSVGESKISGMKYLLNKGQIEEIRKALISRISMIQGPPGTGKSYVGAHLAYYFLQCNQLNPDEPKNILYCGPSNKSVDVVAEYLLQTKIKVLRVYGNTYEEKDYPNPLRSKADGNARTEKKPSDKIKAITLHQIIRKETNSLAKEICQFDAKFAANQNDITIKDYKKYKKIVSRAKLEEFQKHDVIICTCATAAMLGDSLEDFGIAQCIIDECGMCSEPETLAPIVASKAGQDPEICDFPSTQFYKGRLETDQSVLEREERRSFRFCYPPHSNNTAVFCHVAGTESQDYENSFYNEQEARVVIKVLFYLYRKKISQSNIMILTPYSAQVATIKSLIMKERSQLKDVHVGTVVSSQGSESDFVILSTVRSRPKSAIEDQANLHWRRRFIGFVTDRHQINVAITRAKSGLCIVGNQFLLEKDTETWKPLLKNYRRRKSVVNCDDRNAPWNVA